jgi:hypothetical protein
VNTREIAQLMELIIGFDGREPGDAELEAWAQAARHGHWSLPEALAAVIDHYTTTTEWLKPAHITTHIRDRRAAAVRRENDRRVRSGQTPLALVREDEPVDLDGPVDAAPGPEGLPLGRDVPGRRLSAALQQVHDDAAVIVCPACRAPAVRGEEGRCRWPDGSLCRIPHVIRMTGARKVLEARLAHRPEPQLPEPLSDDQAWAVPCPTCKVPAGSACTQRLDRTRTVATHPARLAVAREARDAPVPLEHTAATGAPPV